MLRSGENARFDARKVLRSNLKIDECLFLNVTSMYLISRISNVKVILYTSFVEANAPPFFVLLDGVVLPLIT